MGNDHKQLTFVPPNELHDYWDLIKPGLQKVKEHSSDGWMEEDVFSELRAGRSTLHIGDVDGYAGFIILTPQQAFDCAVLFIWCCYSVDPKVDVVEIFFPELRKMARQMKARKTLDKIHRMEMGSALKKDLKGATSNDEVLEIIQRYTGLRGAEGED